MATENQLSFGAQLNPEAGNEAGSETESSRSEGGPSYGVRRWEVEIQISLVRGRFGESVGSKTTLRYCT
jgi:hypothetical protein